MQTYTHKFSFYQNKKRSNCVNCRVAIIVYNKHRNRMRQNNISEIPVSTHTGNLSQHEAERPNPKASKTRNVRIKQHWGASVQPMLQWKSNEHFTTCACICSLRYPACNAHAPYCHLWPAPFYNIFTHCLINGTTSEKTLLNIKCVLSFSTTFV